MKKLAAFLALVALPQAWANPQLPVEPLLANIPKALCESVLTPKSDQAWVKARAYLQNNLEHSREVLNSYFISEKTVTDFRYRLGQNYGAVSSLVGSVDTLNGPMALKIFKKYPPEQFAVAIHIQEILGHFGVAPKVRGIIPNNEIQALITRFPAIKVRLKDGPDNVGFGLLMDEVPDAWAPKSDGLRPRFPVRWDKALLEQRILSLEKTLANLRIDPTIDPQVAITPAGKAYLIDFDSYRFITESWQAYSEIAQPLQLSEAKISDYKRNSNNLRSAHENLSESALVTNLSWSIWYRLLFNLF